MFTDHARKFLLPSAVPTGHSGKWKVEKFTVSAQQARRHNLRSWMNENGDCCIKPGKYTRLIHNNQDVWMSDTPAELNYHLGFVAMASRSVLITGLGLGVVAAACMRKPGVFNVTVVEYSADVIQLVRPTLMTLSARCGTSLDIVSGDAYAWVPDRAFDYAWHDIWLGISSDNAAECRRIMEHYGPYVTKGQECWQEARVFELEEEDKYATTSRVFQVAKGI